VFPDLTALRHTTSPPDAPEAAAVPDLTAVLVPDHAAEAAASLPLPLFLCFFPSSSAAAAPPLLLAGPTPTLLVALLRLDGRHPRSSRRSSTPPTSSYPTPHPSDDDGA
jgi:hypothetical protein